MWSPSAARSPSSGTVDNNVVAVGGSVVLTKTAVVGGNVLSLGGVIVSARDAQVSGSLTEINSSNLYETLTAAMSTEWEGWSWIFAIISLAIFLVILVVALLIVALLPKPVRIVAEAITGKHLQSGSLRASGTRPDRPPRAPLDHLGRRDCPHPAGGDHRRLLPSSSDSSPSASSSAGRSSVCSSARTRDGPRNLLGVDRPVARRLDPLHRLDGQGRRHRARPGSRPDHPLRDPPGLEVHAACLPRRPPAAGPSLRRRSPSLLPGSDRPTGK